MAIKSDQNNDGRVGFQLRGKRKKGLAIFVGMKERKTSKTVKKN